MNRFANISSIWEPVTYHCIFTLKSQSSGTEDQGSHQYDSASAQQGEVESAGFKCSCLILRLAYVLYDTMHSYVVPWKQLKLSRKDLRERKRLGEVREVKHSGSVLQSRVLFQGCLWLQPCNSTSARCSASWNVRKYARASLQNYYTQKQVCASIFVRHS